MSCECDGWEGLMTSLLPTSPGAVNVMIVKVLWLHSCLRLQELWMWWLWRSYDFTPAYVSRSCECDGVKVLWLHSCLRLQELWMWWLWGSYDFTPAYVSRSCECDGCEGLMTSLLPTSPGAVNVMIVRVLMMASLLPTSPGAVNVMIVRVLWLHSCLRLQELWMWWLWRSYGFTPAYVSRSCECDDCEGLMASLLPTSPGAVNVMIVKVLWLHSCLRLQELWMWWLWRSYDFTPAYVSRSCECDDCEGLIDDFTPAYVSRSCECDGCEGLMTSLLPHVSRSCECDDCEGLMTSLLPTSPGAVNVMVVKVLWLHSCLRLQELWMWWLWRSCDFTPAYVSRSCECDDCEGLMTSLLPTSPGAVNVMVVKVLWLHSCLRLQELWMWWLWRSYDFTPAYVSRSCECDGCECLIDDFTPTYVSRSCECNGCEGLMTSLLPTSPGAVNVMIVKVLWLHSCLRLQELWMWWLWKSCDFTPAYVSRSCECDDCEGLMTSLLPTSPGAVNVMVVRVLWLHSRLRLQELWMWWLWRSYDFTPAYVSRSCECDGCEGLMTSLLPTSPGAVNVMVEKVLWLHSCLRLQELWM